LIRTAAVLGLLTVGAARLAAQEGAAAIGERLLADITVLDALERARANEAQTLEEQVSLCEIPAPPFQEEKRGAAVKAAFEGLGLRNVRTDAIGNVLAERPGRAARPHLVVAAHLDTVFPEGTDVTVRRDGALLIGPGIGDNCRGLAALIAVVRALQQAGIVTAGTITFVANVGEEALGNLRGVRYLFETELKGRVDRFVSIDGSGTAFTHVGVGANRYRIAFKGPGGHSYFAFGSANPAHALGRAIAKIADLEVAKDPRTTFNVGRLGGGTSVNSIASEAWMEVDMRSHDAASLQALDEQVRRAVAGAVQEENARWGGRAAIAATWEDVGSRVPGLTPADAPIVEATRSVTRALGMPVKTFLATTDSNVAMALGVPAVTIDGGGDGSGGHALGEVFDSTDSWKGTQRALLLVLALAQP
jgi:acetylornithine deacetylase/succinyl-diaminopimelate desuccinylase-like protein